MLNRRSCRKDEGEKTKLLLSIVHFELSIFFFKKKNNEASIIARFLRIIW